MKSILRACLFSALILTGFGVSAQNFSVNYDESLVKPYTLPDPLVFNNGKRVRNARQWNHRRRAEILEIFASEMYGHVPGRPAGLHSKVLSEETVFEGLGIRKTVRLYLDSQEEHWFDVMIHQPANSLAPVPVFTGINFQGNDATLTDDGTEELDGRRWPYRQILEAGFAVATCSRNEIEPDTTEPTGKGVRSWYNPGGDWGAISAWAWALSRVMDYIETDPSLDASRVAVTGHSRLGKTALWAGANDPRFAIVISNDSGCCGAAISRRVFGETFEVIGTTFPHWFCARFQHYLRHEDAFPADQHWLAALIAPRPLYIASASGDLWADPKGEWLCAQNVGPVYRLFKKPVLSGREMPVVSPDAHPGTVYCDNAGTVGYHIRVGRHDILAPDWEQYILFARRFFKM